MENFQNHLAIKFWLWTTVRRREIARSYALDCYIWNGRFRHSEFRRSVLLNNIYQATI